MENDQVKKALSECQRILEENRIEPVKHDIDKLCMSKTAALQHSFYMCPKALKYLHENNVDKAMRWLGFMQGVLWSTGLVSIQSLKKQNKPE